MGVIKKDLEYIAHHHPDANFDLWEESFGHHFYTKMVQRKALVLGAALAKKLNDLQASVFYQQQAEQLGRDIKRFYDFKNKQIRARLTKHTGPQKKQELDMSIILGVLHGQLNGYKHSQYVERSFKALSYYFEREYQVNTHSDVVLYGRYPNDLYDGYETNGKGNPWFILSATAAEYLYQRACHFGREDFRAQGDALMMRLKSLAPDLHFHEQINRYTGEGQGAYDLTWSYAAVISAINARDCDSP